MGFNSTVLILNDRLSEIEKDPKFGQKLSDAVRSFDYEDTYITGQTQVLSCQHASDTVIIGVGGNCGTRLDTLYHTNHHTEADKLKIVQQMADNLGYVLTKKEDQ